MDVQPIEKYNLVDIVYEQIKKQIVSGEIAEGSKLDSENELAKGFNVSRGVIREALGRLKNEHLIVTRQGLGSYVANPENFHLSIRLINLTEQDFLDFLNFRRSVEYSAICLAADAATEEDFDELDRCMSLMNEDTDPDSYGLLDYQFHLQIVRCAHNEYLENAMRANESLLITVFTAMNSISDAWEYLLRTHHDLAKSIRTRDPETTLGLYNDYNQYNMTRMAAMFKDSLPTSESETTDEGTGTEG